MEYPIIDLKATGQRIRQLRKENHLKVWEVADFLGSISEQAVYKWQRGESLPSVDNLYALSRLFGTSVDDILRGSREEGESPLLPFCLLEIFKQAFSTGFSHIFKSLGFDLSNSLSCNTKLCAHLFQGSGTIVI